MIYPYRCTDCLHRWSERRTVDTRDDPTSCPSCGKPGTRTFASPHVAPMTGIPNRIDDEITRNDKAAKAKRAQQHRRAAVQAQRRADALGLPSHDPAIPNPKDAP